MRIWTHSRESARTRRQGAIDSRPTGLSVAEYENLRLERRKMWLQVAALAGPLLVVAGTYLFQVSLQREQALAEFRLKAAEIIMDTPSASATQNRGRALAALFPGQLPEDFAQEFNPDLYGSSPSTDAKMEMFRAAAAQAKSISEVVGIWKHVFGDWAPADRILEDAQGAEGT